MHTCYTVTLLLKRLLLVSSIEGVRRSLWVGCFTYLLARFINEAVRRCFWGIHLLQRLRVPPGYPHFPRMPVVMLLQLGAQTLGLRKRTPQNHLLFIRCRTALLARFIDEAIRRLVMGHSFASASVCPFGMPRFPSHACSHAPPARRSDIMLAQMNTPKPSAVSDIVWVGNSVLLLWKLMIYTESNRCDICFRAGTR